MDRGRGMVDNGDAAWHWVCPILPLDVRQPFSHPDESRRLRSVLGPLAALLIITSCATTLWAAGQSVLSLWQRQRSAEAMPRTLDWTVLLAARSAHLATARDSGRGPALRGTASSLLKVAHVPPAWVAERLDDKIVTAMCDAGWMGLPPPRC